MDKDKCEMCDDNREISMSGDEIPNMSCPACQQEPKADEDIPLVEIDGDGNVVPVPPDQTGTFHCKCPKCNQEPKASEFTKEWIKQIERMNAGIDSISSSLICTMKKACKIIDAAEEQIEFLIKAKKNVVAENEKLRTEHRTIKAKLNAAKSLGRPHITPEDCPTYYDDCHCTVEALIFNIDRAEKAEAENKLLKAPLEAFNFSTDGMMVVGQELIDLKMKLKTAEVKVERLTKAIEAAIRIKKLWLYPMEKSVTIQQRAEGEALWIMKRQLDEALADHIPEAGQKELTNGTKTTE